MTTPTYGDAFSWSMGKRDAWDKDESSGIGAGRSGVIRRLMMIGTGGADTSRSFVRRDKEVNKDGITPNVPPSDQADAFLLCWSCEEAVREIDGAYVGFVGGSSVSNVANACRLYDVSVKSDTSRLAGNHPGMAISNTTSHCQHDSVLSPPAQFSVMGGATPSDEVAFPTKAFETRHSLPPSYPINDERDSALPSNTTDRDVSRSEAGRIMVPVRRDVCGVTVISTFPDNEYAVLVRVSYQN